MCVPTVSLLIHCSLHLKIVVLGTHPLVGQVNLAPLDLGALHDLCGYVVALVVEMRDQRLVLVGHEGLLFGLRSVDWLRRLD